MIELLEEFQADGYDPKRRCSSTLTLGLGQLSGLAPS
jgi:hypothetical protein